MKSVYVKMVICVAFATSIAGCNSINDNSLLSDAATDPSSNAIDMTPNVTELSLTPDDYYPALRAGDTRVIMSGACYGSTYPRNAIVAYLNGAVLNIVDVSSTTTVGSNTAICHNGRYNVALNLASLSGANPHQVKLIIYGYDSTGAAFQNDGGSPTLSITY